MGLIIGLAMGIVAGLIPSFNPGILVASGMRITIVQSTELLAMILVCEAISSHMRCINRSAATSAQRVSYYWFAKISALMLAGILIIVGGSLDRGIYMVGPLVGTMFVVVHYIKKRGVMAIPGLILLVLIASGIVYYKRIDMVMWLGVGNELFRVPRSEPLREISPETNADLSGVVIGVISGTAWGASLSALTTAVSDGYTSYRRMLTEEVARGVSDGMILMMLLSRGNARLDVQDMIDLVGYTHSAEDALGGIALAIVLAVVLGCSTKYTPWILDFKIRVDQFWLYRSVLVVVGMYLVLGPIPTVSILGLRIVSNQSYLLSSLSAGLLSIR